MSSQSTQIAMLDRTAALAQSCLATLRDANWLTHDRVHAYLRILFGLSLATVMGWTVLARGGLDRLGKPLGTDFLSFWAASKLALSGHPALVYDVSAHAAAEQAVFPAAHIGYAAYFYPPLYLLICLPLAAFPYLPALAAWLGATGYACWRVIRSFLGEAGAGLAILVFAFPGVLSTIGHGQNAFLTTAIFGLAVLTLDRRPIFAGILIGLLAFKPQLGLLIPVALIAAGRWRSLGAAGCTFVVFVAITVAAFGPGTWEGFFTVSPLARLALERDLIGPGKMQSAFAAVRLLHGGVALGYAVQTAVAIFAAAIVVRVARTRAGGHAEGVTLVTASLLASPFLLDYDLMLLAIPLAWTLREARRTGFLRWEKSVMFTAFVLPLVSRAVAARFGVPLGPPVILAVLVVVARRASAPGMDRTPVHRYAVELAAPRARGTVQPLLTIPAQPPSS
jgi:hypothetical protein